MNRIAGEKAANTTKLDQRRVFSADAGVPSISNAQTRALQTPVKWSNQVTEGADANTQPIEKSAIIMLYDRKNGIDTKVGDVEGTLVSDTVYTENYLDLLKLMGITALPQKRKVVVSGVYSVSLSVKGNYLQEEIAIEKYGAPSREGVQLRDLILKIEKFTGYYIENFGANSDSGKYEVRLVKEDLIIWINGDRLKGYIKNRNIFYVMLRSVYMLINYIGKVTGSILDNEKLEIRYFGSKKTIILESMSAQPLVFPLGYVINKVMVYKYRILNNWYNVSEQVRYVVVAHPNSVYDQNKVSAHAPNFTFSGSAQNVKPDISTSPIKTNVWVNGFYCDDFTFIISDTIITIPEQFSLLGNGN